MKSLADLASTERAGRVGEFSSLCRLLAINKGDLGNAAGMAASTRCPQRVVEVLRAAVSVGGAGGSGAWAEEISAYRLLASAFMDQVRHTSAFLRMLNDGAIVRLPLNVIVGDVRTSSSAAILQPGAAIPVSSMSVSGDKIIIKRKAAGLVVLTAELLRDAQVAESLISRNLRTSAGEAVDREFFTELLAGITTMTSVGYWADLTNLLNAIGPDQGSRLYFVAAQDVANLLSTTGDPARFPRVGPVGGGELLEGVPFVVSDGMPAGTLALIDAARLGGNADPVEVSVSTQALLEMDTAPAMSGGTGSPIGPAGPSGALVSLWQQDAVGVMALLHFGFAAVRQNAVAAVFLGGSPA